MNFLSAVKAMQEGKKVKKRIERYYLYMKNKEIFHSGNDEILLYSNIISLITDEATDWEIYEEEIKVKCIYCRKPIHIDKWVGMNKEGMICNSVPCLIELGKEIDYEKEDNWNYVDEIKKMKLNIVLELFKIFIQKVEEDMINKSKENNHQGVSLIEMRRIIDKRSGKL